MLIDRVKKMPSWQRNIIILWIGTFLTGIGNSEIMPFLSLFIDTLGKFSTAELNFWNSVSFSVTFIVMAIVSPIWGKLADRVGRKPMLIRSSIGLAIVTLMMAFVTNVWQIVIIRALQGAFTGYIGNANALVAKDTPGSSVGRAMGIMATGFTSGSLIGPLVGGVMAQLFSYRPTFIITSTLMLFVVIITVVGISEKKPEIKTNAAKEQANSKISDVFAQLAHPKFLIALFITTMLVQTVLMSVNPIMTLFIREMMSSNNAGLTVITGLITSAPGITTVIFAPQIGKLSDRIGTHRIILFGFIVGLISLILSSFVNNVWLLFALRLLTGVSNASLAPVIQTLLTKETPSQFTSRIFSYNQSFQALGNSLGPIIGALIASAFDYRTVFIVAAIITIINLIWFDRNMRVVAKSE